MKTIDFHGIEHLESRRLLTAVLQPVALPTGPYLLGSKSLLAPASPDLLVAGGGSSKFVIQALPLSEQADEGHASIDQQSFIQHSAVQRLSAGVTTPLSAAGGEFRVNTFTTANQRTYAEASGSVASDATGNFVITWTSSGQDGNGDGIYAQRYNAAGAAVGAEFRVNTYTTGNQRYSTVAMDDDGDFVVTWTSYHDGSSGGVFAQRYNASGVAQGSEFRVNSFTSSLQYYSTVAMDADGDFVVTWSSYRDGSGAGVYAQRFNAAGTALGNEFRVNTYTAGNQLFSNVAMEPDGDFVVTWSSYGQEGANSGWGIYAQRYSAAGSERGGEFAVNTFTSNSQVYSTVATDADGDFVITWSSASQDGSGYGVYAQRYNASGGSQGIEFRVNTYTSGSQAYSSVAMDEHGNFLVAWSSFGQDGSSDGVYSQRYNAVGATQGPEFRVNSRTTSAQIWPTVAMDAAGDAVVTWTSYGQDGDGAGVYAQRFMQNTAPTTSGLPAVTVLEDAADSIVDLWSAFADVQTPDNQLTYTITGNTNPSLFTSATINAAAGTLVLDYAPDANGTGNLTVRATDASGLFVESTFAVTVTAVNDAPGFLKGADVTVSENGGVQSVANWATAISRGPADEAGQALAFTLTAANPALFAVQPAIDPLTGTLTFTPAANVSGTTTVTVTLTDNGGIENGGVAASPAQSFTIALTPVNKAPSFTNGAEVTVLEDAGAQTVSGWATAISPGLNESGQTLTFSAVATNPALFAVQPAIDPATGTLTFTPAANANGSTTVSVTLSDNGGTANGGVDTSATQTFTINLTPVNDAPSFIKGSDVTVAEDAGSQTLPGWATAISPGPAEEAGQTLAFAVVASNPALFALQPSIDPATGGLTFTPAANANGSTTVSVILSDNGGTANGGVDTSAPQVFTINLTPVNDAPTFTKGSDVSVA
jgi:hypothetical protein